MKRTNFGRFNYAVLLLGIVCVAATLFTSGAATPSVLHMVGGMSAGCAGAAGLSLGLLISAGGSALSGVAAPISIGLAAGGVLVGAGFLIFCT